MLFYFLRIVLGLAEAGFFPGIILYMTYWFPARERARAMAFFVAASPITGMLGGPLSGGILQYMDQVGELRGWQWLFVLEGIPAIGLGVLVLFCLTDRPAKAGWLTAAERDWLITKLNQEESHRTERHGLSLLQSMADGRVWLLIALYVTIAMGANTFGFYLPALIKERFHSPSEFDIGLLAAVPNAFAAIMMVVNGYHSDRTGERRWHVAVPAFVAALGWLGFAWLEEAPLPSLTALTLSLAALALIQVGIMCMIPTFWTLPTAFLSGVAAAGGIALINAVGNLGGFVGPNILAQSKEWTGSFTWGLMVLSGVMVLGGILALCVRRPAAHVMTAR